MLKYICPNFWFKIIKEIFAKKRELNFYAPIPYFDILNPIVESKAFKREWIKKVKKKFEERLLEKNQNRQTSFHRCLGFTDIRNEGFIVKSSFNFAIETINDEVRIHKDGSILSNDDNNNHNFHDNFPFSFFYEHLTTDLIHPWGANPNVIKMKHEWLMDTPRDVKYLIIPIPYPDDNRFMACQGIQDPMTSRDLTIFFWWYPKNSYEVVKKGTPLCQIIPISKKKIYNSFNMYDYIPEKIEKSHQALGYYKNLTKCPHYSSYKEIAEKIV